MRTGLIDTNPAEHITGPDSPLRRIKRTYGKVQARNPGRWLTHDEAFTALIGSCDNSDIGIRDELTLRLGLLGMRAAEIATLTVADLTLGSHPQITWTGKGRKPRHAAPGTRLIAVLTDYLDRYTAALERPVAPTDPVICRQVLGAQRNGGSSRLDWGASAAARTVFQIVTTRAARANLGHVAPHDLRRSAAGILHHAKTADGGHQFDLLDIQKVLGHSDPATTMRSYLDPMDTGVIDRAADYLD